MANELPPNRQALSRKRILEAAIAFADEHGVEALTMRKVAGKLGFGVMSLYNHVANKEEMLIGMVDVVASEFELPPVGGDWKAAIRACAAAANSVLLNHPWAPSEWSRLMPGPARLRFMDLILRILTEAGLRPDLVYRGYHAVTMHIAGFTLQQIGYRQALQTGLDEIASSLLVTLGDDYPYLADHIRAHLDDHDHGDEFGFVLDLILDGLERDNARS